MLAMLVATAKEKIEWQRENRLMHYRAKSKIKPSHYFVRVPIAQL
jgi:hypothetical protein